MVISQSVAPIFTEEERGVAQREFKEVADRNCALFLTRAAFSGNFAERLEEAAAIILFTNLLLMQRSPSGVMKLAQIHVDDPSIPEHAVANSIRGTLMGEFSSLANFELWTKILSESRTIPANLVDIAARSIQFLESYSARQQLAMDESADFFLSFKAGENGDHFNTFTVKEPFYGALNIQVGDEQRQYQWSEFVNFDTISIRHLLQGSHMILDLDYRSNPDQVVEEWLEGLSSISHFG